MGSFPYEPMEVCLCLVLLYLLNFVLLLIYLFCFHFFICHLFIKRCFRQSCDGILNILQRSNRSLCTLTSFVCVPRPLRRVTLADHSTNVRKAFSSCAIFEEGRKNKIEKTLPKI